MNTQQTAQTSVKQKKSLIEKIIVPVLALALLLMLVAWLAGFFNDKVAPQLKPQLTPQTKPQLNSLVTSTEIDSSYIVTSKKSTVFEGVSASIAAKQATIISSRLLARIDAISVRAGDDVKQGDVLITLEQNDLNSQVIEASEQVKAMQARHKEAKQNYKRAQELYKKNITSEFVLDKSKADYQSLVAELTAAKQALKQVKTILSYATLRAPISGKVVDRFTEPGNTAQPGTKLLSLYNPLSLRVEAQVREALALTLTQGQNIKVELPSLNKTLTGLVEEIVPAANTGSRSFLVKVSISSHVNGHENLLPGMYARLLIPAGESNKLYLPANKIASVGQLNFVLLDVNGRAERRFVRLGQKNDQGLVAIISGVQVGDKVLTPK